MAEDLPQQAVYHDNPRADVRPFVPRDVNSVLDVGCGRGGFGRTLRGVLGPSARICGIDPVSAQIDLARVSGVFNELYTGYFPADLPSGFQTVDLVTFNDVLEHFFDPWKAVRRCAELLNQGGRVLAAIPNIQYLPTMLSLAFTGRWDYTEQGILDRTHIRFFTRKTMVQMFEENGFHVELVQGINSILNAGGRYSLIKFTAPVLRDRQWLHFVIVARKI